MHEKVCLNKRTLILITLVIIILSIITSFTVFLNSIKTSYKSRASEPESPSAIVGGTEVVDPTKWPFIVYISKPGNLLDDASSCDGTLIDSQWILTAGHCVSDRFGNLLNKNGFVISIGSNNRDSKSMNDFYVDSIYRHPNYGSKGRYTINDLALIHLKSEITGIETVSLSSDSTIEQDGRMAVVIGWGANVTSSSPYILNQAVIPILSNARANKKDWENGTLISAQIAAGYPKGKTGSCWGDSGGPLLIQSNSKWIQVGIISAFGGWDCRDPKHPGINTRISYSGTDQDKYINYIEWIKKTIKLDSGKPFTGVGSFVGIDLTQDEKKEFIKRIWLDCELQHDDGRPC